MGAAKRRKQSNPNSYGKPLFYSLLFFDQPDAYAFEARLQVRRMGNHHSQIQEAVKDAERLQWCLTWRTPEVARHRLMSKSADSNYSTAKWVAEQLNRKLTNVKQQIDWAPELATIEAARMGLDADLWAVLLDNIETLNPKCWCWEMWTPEGGDGFWDGCLYRGHQGLDESASRNLRPELPDIVRITCAA
jgi:hypothetical protein